MSTFRFSFVFSDESVPTRSNHLPMIIGGIMRIWVSVRKPHVYQEDQARNPWDKHNGAIE